ncbi:TPA: Rgg/GadR/MutR family transcriptional regulator, partial [Enterococcus faecalis]|nr:Rgg/GadR/MutR family transcriptional regulator [Enterococcus faecalis]
CIIEEFNSLINNTDRVNIKDLLKRCEKFLKITDDYYIKDIQMLLKAQLAFQLESINSNVCKSKLLISQIWSRIEKMDVWYYNEIRLLNGILFYFPLETIEAISDKLLYSLKKYSTYAKIKDLEISILTNLSTIYLKNCKMAECEIVLLRMKQLALDLKRYDFLGVYFVRMGICETNSVLIERGMKILTLTDENELIEELNKEIEFFKMTKQ